MGLSCPEGHLNLLNRKNLTHWEEQFSKQEIEYPGPPGSLRLPLFTAQLYSLPNCCWCRDGKAFLKHRDLYLEVEV